MPIKVSKEVLQGLEKARTNGRYNMLDYPRVVELLKELGCKEAYEWAKANKKQYCEGIFQGFEAVDCHI